ncbi:hypothetical protein HHL19_35500 [Streptomyces sp. R302]|uniref:hypothetical protein n=1 Tax=unclassified Streptomyces TaxID=2593676 RepID=UPI00145FB0F9|nr:MULTISPECIES: hypothetical protein [unclassified Streptomyces]NML55154.1 hypothetical protein [Streptomyces sp. R301]NML83816.1 hypothetical protein [Streptomyces sp. R302]
MTTTMTTDHPAWVQALDGTWARAVRAGDGLWMATFGPTGLVLECVEGPDDHKPEITEADPAALPQSVPAELRVELADLGPVVRLANPSLWDAVTTAILRQIVRAEQARVLYRRWSHVHGTAVTVNGLTRNVVPSPEYVLGLDDEAFATIGAKLHRPKLRAAAAAVLEHEEVWTQLLPDQLAAALTTIAGVGPWTAHAAAADFTGDFSVYPHSDLAVRTWAAKIAPSEDWPLADKTGRAFEKHWRHQAGPVPADLHALTLTTLTWGAHARTTEHAGP